MSEPISLDEYLYEEVEQELYDQGYGVEELETTTCPGCQTELKSAEAAMFDDDGSGVCTCVTPDLPEPIVETTWALREPDGYGHGEEFKDEHDAYDRWDGFVKDTVKELNDDERTHHEEGYQAYLKR